MKRGTPDHPKVLMLAQRLGIKKYAVVGLLETLWHFTARYAPRGDIGRFSDGIVATSLDWDGKIPDLIEALVAERWLDKNEQYRLVVHDWSDHSDDAADKYLAEHGMNYADGNQPRRKQKGGKKQRSAGQVATSLDKSGKVKALIPIPIPIPIPTLASGSESGQVATSQESELSGQAPDEVHLILKERPELKALTFEQDLMARKDFKAAPVKIDWLKVVRMVVERAVLAGTINQTGSWLRVQYDKVIRMLYPDIFEKKITGQAHSTGSGQGGEDPHVRIFRTEGDKNGQTNIQ